MKWVYETRNIFYLYVMNRGGCCETTKDRTDTVYTCFKTRLAFDYKKLILSIMSHNIRIITIVILNVRFVFFSLNLCFSRIYFIAAKILPDLVERNTLVVYLRHECPQKIIII